MFLCVAVGILRYASHPFSPCLSASDLAYYNLPVESSFDKQAPKVLLNGWISSYPLLADRKQKTTIHVTKVIVDGTEHVVDGEAQVSVRSRQRLRYGEAVVVRGRLVTPTEFDSFSYRDYLARRGVHSVLYDAQIDVIDPLDPDWFVPQVGQGALAVETRTDNRELRALVGAIDDPITRLAVEAERSFLAELGGDCTLPAGAHATVAAGDRRVEITIQGVLAAADLGHLQRHTEVGPVDAEPGRVLARTLRKSLEAVTS